MNDFTGNGITDFYTVNIQNKDAAIAPDIMSWKLLIDGVSFDVGRWLFSLDRPDDADNASMTFDFTYTAPAASTRTVTQIP